MNPFTITIDGVPVEVAPGTTILDAARKLGLDIPTLCYLKKCGPLNTCQVCLVKINGRLVPSCGTRAEPGMVVESETEDVHEARRTALELLFSDHVGDCLSPCHRLCPLQLNIPVMLRQIQANRFDEAIVTVRETLPLPAVLGRLCHHPCEQGCRRGNWDQPAAIRDLERFVADRDLAGPEPWLLPRKPATGQSVAVIGAGPAGLAAAYFLAREGHAVTLLDRQAEAGGTLRREVAEGRLPRAVLDAELAQFERLGIRFQPGVELGSDVTLEGLLRGFNAVLVAVGELAEGEGERLGLALSGNTPREIPGLISRGTIKTDANTGQTSLRAVFAVGSAVRPVRQLVRAMSEGKMAAACLTQFLAGKPVRRPDRPFSSVTGRLDPGELKIFLQGANAIPSVTPCDLCAGRNQQEAALEASRCLHCDCRSSGNCALQFYAQLYGADANRFRDSRRKFEQYLQPGGILFEPGKCILCGICVKLTEMAAEPLGLTFIGRGFDVRLGAPLNHTIAEGLQKVAAECVEHCPTGALVFSEKTECGAAPLQTEPIHQDEKE